jgi:hypothetical protein
MATRPGIAAWRFVITSARRAETHVDVHARRARIPNRPCREDLARPRAVNLSVRVPRDSPRVDRVGGGC